VPMTAAVWVMPADGSLIARAMPKSITLISPARVSITFAGFMSRWTMPLRWLKSSAAQTSAIHVIAACGAMVPSRRNTSRRVSPSTYSITMYGSGPPLVCASPVS